MLLALPVFQNVHLWWCLLQNVVYYLENIIIWLHLLLFLQWEILVYTESVTISSEIIDILSIGTVWYSLCNYFLSKAVYDHMHTQFSGRMTLVHRYTQHVCNSWCTTHIHLSLEWPLRNHHWYRWLQSAGIQCMQIRFLSGIQSYGDLHTVLN